ncbi:ESX secretion-associated protein EspG [Nocardia sp. NPDC052254]|uniref:ESX secretion-associated protein EspG n=1 Tax=Nocardia sp. NPDC052254 TaxID=3155681 RepID=UPI003435CE49
MTARTSWEFTPDEFAYVWASETGLVGDYPQPINIIESTTTAEEYERQRMEISGRFPRAADPDLTGPLRVLADPDLRIVCNGWFHNSARRVRSHAAAVGELGVVVFQKIGATADFGGDIKLVVTNRDQLGRHIAATMPTMSAGAAGRMVGYTPRVRGEEPPSSWLRDSSGKRPVEERIRILLRLERSAQGYLRIDRYLHDRRPFPPDFVSWLDIGDASNAQGRYLIDVDDNDTVVTPASADVIAQELYRRAELGQW